MEYSNAKKRLIFSTSYNPWFNLALEEYLFNNMDENTVIMYLWQNENTVVIGKTQNAWKECRTALLEEEGGYLARRSTGGGAVYHDLGNMCYTFMASSDLYDLEKQLKVILGAVKDQGIDAKFTGRNDITLMDGRKFSGNAFKFAKDKGLMHGTLLLNTDSSVMAKYLQVSKAKMQAKGVESVRSRVANLIELNPKITPEKISVSLKNEFLKEYGSWETEEIYSIDGDHPEELQELFEKYSSWEYRYGETPSFDMSFENRFTWGGIDINLSAKKGVITKAYVYSDAMDTTVAETLTDILLGTPLDRDEIENKLSIAGMNLTEIEDVKNWLAEVL